MITVRRYAEFETDLPDDTVWNETETAVLQTGGKNVTEAVADVLVRLGCKIE